MTREEAIKHIITYAYYEDDIPLQVANRIGHGNLRSPSPAGAGEQAAERMDQR